MFWGVLTKGKDIFACPSPEHPEYLPELKEFNQKVPDFMNDSDKKT